MLGRPKLFVSGPLHGETRMVEGSYLETISNPLSYTSITSETKPLHSNNYQTFRYEQQRFYILGSYVDLMVPIPQRIENIQYKVLDVMLSSAAKSCAYSESDANVF